MTYLKVLWKQKLPGFPVELFSELDGDRYETRKVERFADGNLQFAGPEGESGDTWLGETPIPAPEIISQDPVFIVCPLTRGEFEMLYQDAVISKAA